MSERMSDLVGPHQAAIRQARAILDVVRPLIFDAQGQHIEGVNWHIFPIAAYNLCFAAEILLKSALMMTTGLPKEKIHRLDCLWAQLPEFAKVELTATPVMLFELMDVSRGAAILTAQQEMQKELLEKADREADAFRSAFEKQPLEAIFECCADGFQAYRYFYENLIEGSADQGGYFPVYHLYWTCSGIAATLSSIDQRLSASATAK